MEKWEEKLVMSMPFWVFSQEKYEGIGPAMRALWRSAHFLCKAWWRQKEASI